MHRIALRVTQDDALFRTVVDNYYGGTNKTRTGDRLDKRAMGCYLATATAAGKASCVEYFKQ